MPIRATTLTHSLADRELAVLQLLGRLGMMESGTIHDLLFPDRHETSRNRMLAKLLKQRLIWSAKLPGQRDDTGRPDGRTPRVYGLTDEGRATLARHEIEPTDGLFALDRLVYRPKTAPTDPDRTMLVVNTFISNWVGSLLEEIRKLPMLMAANAYRDYALRDASGATLQTIGALITLRLDPSHTSFDRDGWTLPWRPEVPSLPATGQVREVRLAMEVDNGRRSAKSIFEMAQTYQRFTQEGRYQRLFGGAVTPVIITLPGDRAKEVADIWMQVWDKCPAVLSTPLKTNHPEHGVLWGEYVILRTRPVGRGPLLGDLLGTVEQWPTRSAQWSPTLRVAGGAAASRLAPPPAARPAPRPAASGD